MTFLCVGLSHKQAPIAVREQIAVRAEEVEGRLHKLKALPGVKEAMLVSTCNRLEIFAVSESRDAAEDVLETLGPVAAPHALCRFDEEAVRHLFRVAASLDSMVVGEAQILGQVKEAASVAQQVGAIGPELSRALARATTAAKRVRTETEIARGAVSVSSVAVQLAHKLLGSLEGRSVMLLGAGEMAQLAARELRSAGARELLVANRSAQRAEELAREVDGTPVSLAELPSLLERADVAICSTGAAQHVVTREMVARTLKARRYRAIFFVDLTLPRNVEPSVNELENVYVYDLDDLERAAMQGRAGREAAARDAWRIVDAEVVAFRNRRAERAAVPAIVALREHFERVRAAVIAEANDRDPEAVTRLLVNRLLHGPSEALRRAALDGEGDGAALEVMLRRLFRLEDGADEEKDE